MRILIASAALLLGACSTASTGPSLARRPIETRGLDEPARTATPPAAADATLREKIAAALASVERGRADFAGLVGQVETAVAAAGAEGSESWIAAQQLLSALEGARAPSPAGLADLDTLLTTRLAAGQTAGITELEAARASALPIVEAQDAAIDRLRRRISP
jgi:hypothetical protein